MARILTNEKMWSAGLDALRARLISEFRRHYGADPESGGFAPGRVEVLGNHTDYNEGYVLSAALQEGILFLARREPGAGVSRLYAADFQQEIRFETMRPAPCSTAIWANYPLGVWHLLMQRAPQPAPGFAAAFGGNLPIGAGLSSSAALSVSAALTMSELLGLKLETLELARLAQQAEHDFAGVRCGLLDQISSLFGAEGALVFTDFRTLSVRTVTLRPGYEFLLCHTGVKHQLVESAYNERRAACERAAAHFAGRLAHPVHALRDVSLEEWERFRDGLDEVTARRARHVIGENVRVLRAVAALDTGDLVTFGRLMNESHESSRIYFENSCEELDFCVEAFRKAGALGARLSGGGFGGSVIALVRADQATAIAHTVEAEVRAKYGPNARVREIQPAAGARRVPLQ